ncbi:MAG: hypothetical protein QOC81_4843 [Thermoanaerobaculia bacterium]|jgi:autotransporter-associated beta strand protein|nr:hypothetical protein [Thermoanaerobaculia bacterium]
MSKTSLGVAALLCLLSVPGFAASHIWSGAVNEQFSNPGNWSGGSPAGDANADLSFPGGARPAARNDIANLSVRSISFSARDYSITGNAIRFGQNAEIMDSTEGGNVISCDIILSSDVRITAAGWSVAWPYSTLPGLTLSGSISGSGGVEVTGSGRVVFGGGAANTYTGPTRVLYGELQLKKPAGTNAVPGELRIESTNGNYEYGFVSTFADEQIPDTAPITVFGPYAILGVGGRETIGPVTARQAASFRTSAYMAGYLPATGTLILGGDIDIDGIGTTSFSGNIVLPASRTITMSSGSPSAEFWGLSAGVPGAGLLVKGGLDGLGVGNANVQITGSYDGPTIIEGGIVNLSNSSSPVILRGGAFWGTCASLTAESGLVRAGSYLGGVITGNVRLASPVTVDLDFTSYSPPRIQLNGALDLADAQLTLAAGVVRQPGTVYTIIANASSQPVVGTFHGLPEGTIIGDRWRISYVGGNGNDVTVTEAGHLVSMVKLTVTQSYVTVGESVALRAEVSAEIAGTTPTGTVTFSEGAAVVASVPLNNGVAETSATFLRGNHLITATYSGAATIQPSQAQAGLTVVERTPVIASVDPSTVLSGTTTTLIIHGSNFVDGSNVNGYPTSFVSSSELHVEFPAPPLTYDSYVMLTVQQPGPGSIRSASSRLNTTATPHDPPVPTLLVFGAQSVTAPVTPGAMTAWLSVTWKSNVVTAANTVLSDDDQDGSVVWALTKPTPPAGTFTVMDLSARKILAGQPNSAYSPAPLPFPQKTFLRNPDGNYSHIVLASSYSYTDTWSLLWARPGVGAWKLSFVGDGYGLDLDHGINGVFELETSSMMAVGSSPPPPAGIAPGDLFASIKTSDLTWFGDRVDDHLAESAGAGVISFVDRFGTSAAEKTGVAHVKLLRVEGTDGTVSVQFATADLTAHAGERYVAQAGTVTFGPGEILKTIDIPLIDDHSYTGNDTFGITISNPAGATIGVASSVVVSIIDGDPIPVLSMTPSLLSVQEGDSGTIQIPITVTMTGVTSKQVSANWYYTDPAGYGSTSGQLLFNPGETQKTFSVKYKANTTPEPNRTITAGFGELIGATAGTTTSITIVDDDFATVSISDASVSESAGTVTVRLNASKRSNKPVSVTYATSDASAVAGSDYTARSGTITFDQSTTVQTISIPILNDTIAEGTKSFVFTLTGVQNAHLGRSTAIISIVDDDTPTSSTPTGMSATATGPAAVIVTWFPVANATYEIYRSSFASPFAPLISTPQTWFTDTSVVSGTTYLYKVRAITSGTPSAFGAVDAATTIAFTDDPLISGTTSVKAVHINELRAAITAMRTAAGLTTSFDGSPSSGSLIRAADISQLRTALDAARAVIQLPALVYSDPLLTAGTTSIKAGHIQQLRDGCR